MSSTNNSNVLSAKDANLPLQVEAATKDVKSMEYHRQVLQSKMAEEKNKQQYTSPSDNIMSPCSAKLSAFRGKQAGKVKPKSLFAQASSKRLEGDTLFGGSKTQ